MEYDKQVNKHLLFVSKRLNWTTMPEERRIDKVKSYVLNKCKNDGKRQDFARALHTHNPVTSYEMLTIALEVRAIA